MNTPMTEIFSRNLRNTLYMTGFTQADLARRLRVSETSVSNWINGNAVPRPNMVDKICAVLRCKREDLMVDRSQKMIFAPEDLLAQEMQNRPDLYNVFNGIMRLSSSDIELVKILVERLSK